MEIRKKKGGETERGPSLHQWYGTIRSHSAGAKIEGENAEGIELKKIGKPKKRKSNSRRADV